MNVVLALLVVSEACFAICIWLSPEGLRRVAAHLLTRADVIDAAKAEHRRRIQFWCGELGVARETITVETAIVHPAITTLAQN